MTQLRIPRLVVAAPHSGSGKSTIASGLMAALAATGKAVQGFKVGPDYIDPGYHAAATDRPSRNLDTWMVSKESVLTTFARAAQDADVAVIEGVMGLYDGYDAQTERGSTAEVAKLLGAPVLLVIDVGRMARSAGATALGYRDFDPDLTMAGVICNKTGSEKHALWVTQAIEGIGLPVLGCLPRKPSLLIPERHLGLHTAVERAEEGRVFLRHAAELITDHIDLARVLALAADVEPLTVESPRVTAPVKPRTRIAVAYDAAFCFYYEDNFDLLREAGADLIFFSPISEDALPKDIGGLYLGGGYPELYAERLAGNTSLMDAIRQAVAAGMPTYAECGGLMFLTESITDLRGNTYPMIGAVPGRAQMRERLAMGYREVTALRDTILLPAGGRARGHEFHYSDWSGPLADDHAAYQITPRLREEVRAEGYVRDNVLASYVHLHFSAHRDLAWNFVDACTRWRGSRLVRVH